MSYDCSAFMPVAVSWPHPVPDGRIAACQRPESPNDILDYHQDCRACTVALVALALQQPNVQCWDIRAQRVVTAASATFDAHPSEAADWDPLRVRFEPMLAAAILRGLPKFEGAA